MSSVATFLGLVGTVITVIGSYFKIVNDREKHRKALADKDEELRLEREKIKGSRDEMIFDELAQQAMSSREVLERAITAEAALVYADQRFQSKDAENVQNLVYIDILVEAMYEMEREPEKEKRTKIMDKAMIATMTRRAPPSTLRPSNMTTPLGMEEHSSARLQHNAEVGGDEPTDPDEDPGH